VEEVRAVVEIGLFFFPSVSSIVAPDF